jgi:hypothetical protein
LLPDSRRHSIDQHNAKVCRDSAVDDVGVPVRNTDSVSLTDLEKGVFLNRNTARKNVFSHSELLMNVI